jgi:bifunctional non-homologous end joining protein LigD
MPLGVPPPRRSRFGSVFHWVKAKLVAQVRYLSWTAEGLLQQVVYLGLREDKPAGEVVRDSRARSCKEVEWQRSTCEVEGVQYDVA